MPTVRDLAPGLDDPMAFVIFAVMAGIAIVILALPGNILNPIGTNSTFTGYFGQGRDVLVYNPSTTTAGILAIVVPLMLFWMLRSWATGKSENE